jgi:flagellar biosynthetic protein FlhB
MADSNKTEKPSARRLERARSDGQFVVSREAITAGQFVVVVAMMGALFPAWFSTMKALVHESLAAAFQGEVDVSRVPGTARALIDRAFLPLGVLAAAAVGTSLAVHLSVTRLGFSFKKFQPDFTRFEPIGKIRQIAQQAPSAVFQAVAMLIVFSATLYYVARENATLLLALPFASLSLSIAKIGGSIKDLLWKAAALFIVFGVLDLVRQRRRFTKQLRMSKQELKDEVKEMEGNPQIRGKIRQLRRDLARRRMMKAVPTATAVIVNPTHFAVALKYDHSSMGAPVVIAKGKNYIALRIRQIAIENQVPLVENPPLAQALYKSVDVGREIPPNLYRVVAEVLAYIHRLTNVHRQSRTPKR